MKLKDKRSLKVLDRLKVQLKSGVKPSKESQEKRFSKKGLLVTIPLEDKDKERIQNEISILETKLKHYLN